MISKVIKREFSFQSMSIPRDVFVDTTTTPREASAMHRVLSPTLNQIIMNCERFPMKEFLTPKEWEAYQRFYTALEQHAEKLSGLIVRAKETGITDRIVEYFHEIYPSVEMIKAPIDEIRRFTGGVAAFINGIDQESINAYYLSLAKESSSELEKILQQELKELQMANIQDKTASIDKILSKISPFDGEAAEEIRTRLTYERIFLEELNGLGVKEKGIKNGFLMIPKRLEYDFATHISQSFPKASAKSAGYRSNIANARYQDLLALHECAHLLQSNCGFDLNGEPKEMFSRDHGQAIQELIQAIFQPSFDPRRVSPQARRSTRDSIVAEVTLAKAFLTIPKMRTLIGIDGMTSSAIYGYRYMQLLDRPNN